MRRLIDAALHSEDDRVRVTACNLVLERAWGRVREAKEEQPREASIDLSRLKAEELQILLQLVQSGRLTETATPAEIDGKVEG
jgi:hypothetical protein